MWTFFKAESKKKRLELYFKPNRSALEECFSLLGVLDPSWVAAVTSDLQNMICVYRLQESLRLQGTIFAFTLQHLLCSPHICLTKQNKAIFMNCCFLRRRRNRFLSGSPVYIQHPAGDGHVVTENIWSSQVSAGSQHSQRPAPLDSHSLNLATLKSGQTTGAELTVTPLRLLISDYSYLEFW